MKTLSLFLFPLVFLFILACNDSSENSKQNSTNESTSDTLSVSHGYRYDLKSGVVTSKSKLLLMNGDITSVNVLYFDDHGKKSMVESVQKTSITSMGPVHTDEIYMKRITIDDVMYSWKVGQKTGTKLKIYKIEGGEDIDFKQMIMGYRIMDFKNMSEEIMEQWKIKKTGNRKVFGKQCDVFEMDEVGMKGKYFIWDNITMKADETISGTNRVVEVTELKENASIPASTFEVPGDVTFTEITMPAN